MVKCRCGRIHAHDAYGNCNVYYSSSDTDIASVNPIRYRGYYHDEDAGLYYLNARYYNPQWRRFIEPAGASSLNPDSVNGLNLYCYAGNNPVGNNGGFRKNSNSEISSSSGHSSTYVPSNIIINPVPLDPNFLSNIFAHNENVFSTVAGVIEGIRRYHGLDQLDSLSKISKALMHTGYWLNVALSAYNNYIDESLTTQEKWVSFVVDTVHNTGQTVGAFFLGCIPYAGPFLAIGVPILVDYLWSGELCIFGFDINVQPVLINGKTVEEWVKYWVNSWFE